MTTRRPALFVLVLAALAAATLSGCGEGRSWPENGIRVVVTAPALDSFARKVVGDHGTVRCLCEGPTCGVEDFEPSREHAALLRHADFLFINGLGLDDAFAEQLRINSGNPHLKYVAVGELVPEDQRLKGPDGAVDPHVWMGITQARAMVNGVRDRLKEHDPEHAADYDANAEGYVNDLNNLLQKGRDAVSNVREMDRKVVALHDPLRYFAADLGVSVAGSVEAPPGAEPPSRRRDEIAELCKKEHVRLLAVPKEYPEKTFKYIREELKKRGVDDAEQAAIDPLETADELQNPDWYKDRMTANIDALIKALTE